MTLKSGSPTNFRLQTAVTKRHQRRVSGGAHTGVGETYQDRLAYKKQVEEKSSKTSIFGKIKDYFSGSKAQNVQGFAANANYVGGAQTIREGFRSLEQGNYKSSASGDEELLDILNNIE